MLYYLVSGYRFELRSPGASMSARTYNLKDISNEIALEYGLTQKRGAELARFVLERIQEELVSGKQVRLHQFGTLQARTRAAGVARNLVTGELVGVPSRRVVRLTVSPSLKR